ncbi:hypothetical protein ACVINZ_004963 [Mesorhizobium jarvisii]
MPFSATVFNVLIASPSDLPGERAAIAQSLQDWNSLHSEDQGKILLPVMWETHSAPSMGDRPQGLINERVVKRCDILIGSFWNRLGSPTGVEESGTVEEVKWFLANKKPVMLYYSKATVDMDTVDLDQYKKLREFKGSIRDKGIQEDYHSVGELREKLSRHLTIVMREMSVAPVIDKRTVEAARASTRSGVAAPTVEPKSTVVAPIALFDYTEKAFIVRGDTVDFKEKLRELGGKWISTKDGGKAWMFSKRRLNEVAVLLQVGANLHPIQ